MFAWKNGDPNHWVLNTNKPIIKYDLNNKSEIEFNINTKSLTLEANRINNNDKLISPNKKAS